MNRQEHRGGLHGGVDVLVTATREPVQAPMKILIAVVKIPGAASGEDDLAEGLAGGAPVDHGGLLELLGHLPELVRFHRQRQ